MYSGSVCVQCLTPLQICDHKCLSGQLDSESLYKFFLTECKMFSIMPQGFLVTLFLPLLLEFSVETIFRWSLTLADLVAPKGAFFVLSVSDTGLLISGQCV